MDGSDLTSPIRNRVEESGLKTLDLDALIPREPTLPFDLADFLEHGLILKEKSFREGMKTMEESQWMNRPVAVFCSADAIIPDWAWMLATSKLTALGAQVWIGREADIAEKRLLHAIEKMDVEVFRDERVVVKGCSAGTTAAGLAHVIQRLQPVVKSIFYGEPCSTVPVYKRPSQSR
jgi:hypothetical protein